VRFLHALGIVYWETAQINLAKQVPAERDWAIGTALLVLLLGTEEFWDYFAQNRWTTEQGERRSLTLQEQRDLMQTVLKDILMTHSVCGSQNVAAGRYNLAQIHIRCLDICRMKGQKLRLSLETYGISYALSDDQDKINWIAREANKVLDEWCVNLQNQAIKELNNAEIIKILPEGIRKNYEGGLHILEPFIALNISIARILTLALDWYNDWSDDLSVLKKAEELKKLVESARLVADQLIPLCSKEQAYTQENRVISQHYLYRGYVLDDPELSKQVYEESLAWNPANIDAEYLLERVSSYLLYIWPILEYKSKKEFDKAYEALDVTELKIRDKNIIQELRSAVYFQHGVTLADEGKYREALALAKKSYQLDPDEASKQFVEAMEKMAPEEGNIRLIEQAEEALRQGQYNQVIQYASGVPKSSWSFDEASNLQAVAYLQRGIAIINYGDLERGEADIEYALMICSDMEMQKDIKKQLSVFYLQHGIALAEEGKYHEALALGKKSYQFDQNEEYEQFVEAMEEMVLEEDNIRLIEQAKKALEQGQYDQVIHYIASVSENSCHFDYACYLQAMAYFQRGVSLAHEGYFVRGEEDIRYALKLCDDADIQKEMKEQLSAILNGHARRVAESLEKSPSLSNDAFIIRVNIARRLLEEAIKCDPSNLTSRENLKVLNDLFNR
jgi:tetratricopeptide (TPR) repeat protein